MQYNQILIMKVKLCSFETLIKKHRMYLNNPMQPEDLIDLSSPEKKSVVTSYASKKPVTISLDKKAPKSPNPASSYDFSQSDKSTDVTSYDNRAMCYDEVTSDDVTSSYYDKVAEYESCNYGNGSGQFICLAIYNKPVEIFTISLGLYKQYISFLLVNF